MVKNYLDYAGLKRVIGKLFGIRKIWHGTATEWDALTPAERDYYDQAEIIEGEDMDPFEPHTYSTDEKRVGTWIDGKPIYRKVLLCTTQTVLNSTLAAWQTVPGWSIDTHGLNILSVKPMIRSWGNRVDYNTEDSYNNIIQFFCLVSQFTVLVGWPLAIEYTKTMD